jgi:hypothetical protein
VHCKFLWERGLPAKAIDAVHLTNRSACFAGKPGSHKLSKKPDQITQMIVFSAVKERAS